VAVDWLGLFAGKPLHRALVDAGHEVSVRTVQRWIAGTSPPKAQDLEAIRRLLPGGQEPPAWAKRLLEGVLALEAKAGVSESELAQAQARAAAALALARRGPRRPGDGDGGGAASA
jgi:predicted DNA-binding transcriptional regulator YafY